MALRGRGKRSALRGGGVGQGSVGRSTHRLGTRGEVFGQRYQAVTLERQDEVREHMAGEQGGEGPRRIAGFPVGDESATAGHGGPEEVATRVGIGHKATFGNRQNGRLTSLEVSGLVQRMSHDDALSRVRQRLGDSFEQGGVTTGEEYHDLSLGRGAYSVKGWKRLTINLQNLVS